MIPKFPQFKKIELADRAEVEKHTNLFEPYSDFNFTCLWAWDVKEERMLSELNGNLVVKFTDYQTHEPFLSFLGNNNIENTTQMLLDYCKANNLPATLRLMPDISIDGLSPTSFTIEEARGDFDYILAIQELISLPGTQFHRRRKNANRFWRENPSAKLENAACHETQAQKQIFKTIDTWENNKTILKKDYVIENELKAIKRIFADAKLPSLFAYGLFVDDTMLGFVIGEVLQKGYALVHFMKSDISYNGCNEALMQGLARHLDSLSVEWINIESDLDVENMRQSKLSWRPAKFLKRYNVRYAQN